MGMTFRNIGEFIAWELLDVGCPGANKTRLLWILYPQPLQERLFCVLLQRVKAVLAAPPNGSGPEGSSHKGLSAEIQYLPTFLFPQVYYTYMEISQTDISFLHRTLFLAAQGTSAVYPNPRVGAVLVHHGRILGEGFHARSGGPHAEVVAISQAQAAGHQALFAAATLYVSLEPCCAHPGKRTPPCANLILASGIGRVVIGTPDPNPGVAGNGIAQLRAAGVEVQIAPDSHPFVHQNRVFWVNQLQQRPYVVLKWAQSADGFLGGFDANGNPAPVSITGPEARRFSHSLRAWHHAIAVGRGTWEADHPALTTRLFPGLSPNVLVLTRQPGWQPAAPAKAWHLPANQPLTEALSQLWQQARIASMVVEGGAAVLNAFLQAGIADEVHVWENPYRQIGKGTPAPLWERGWNIVAQDGNDVRRSWLAPR